MDDSRISLVSTEEVLRSEAYMLFYRVVDHPYSKKLANQVKALNDSYDVSDSLKAKEEKEAAVASRKRKEKETKDASIEIEKNSADASSKNSSRLSDRSIGSGPAASVKRNHRKRKAPEFFCGEEWARSKTVIAEKNIARFRDVEGKVSRHITFTPEFEKLLSEHALKTNAKIDQIPSSGSSLLDNCGDSSTEDINITLLRCFLAVSKNDGIVDFAPTPTPTMTTRSSAASRGKLQSSAIHVVDPTDDLL